MLARIIVPAFVAASLVTPAQAQESSETVMVVVDKSARASKVLLNRRIAAAVEEVCGSYSTIESYQVPEIDSCRAEAWKSAKRQLAAIHSEGLIALRSR